MIKWRCLANYESKYTLGREEQEKKKRENTNERAKNSIKKKQKRKSKRKEHTHIVISTFWMRTCNWERISDSWRRQRPGALKRKKKKHAFFQLRCNASCAYGSCSWKKKKKKKLSTVCCFFFFIISFLHEHGAVNKNSWPVKRKEKGNYRIRRENRPFFFCFKAQRFTSCLSEVGEKQTKSQLACERDMNTEEV